MYYCDTQSSAQTLLVEVNVKRSTYVLIHFQRDATLHSLFISGKLLYMFRVVSSPIIRSTYNCICRIWYFL